MGPTLGFSFRNALHAMNTAFVLELAVGPVADHFKSDLLKSTHCRLRRNEHLQFPLHGFYEVLVHLKQIAREDPGFVSTRSCSNLQHNILRVIWIFRKKQESKFIFK